MDAPTSLAREATSLVRRMMPFPGAGGTPPEVAPQPLAQIADVVANVANVANVADVRPGASNLYEQAGTLVPRAAAILDEDMARGVLSARDVPPLAHLGTLPQGLTTAGGDSLLKDFYAFGERLAAFMPQGAAAAESPFEAALPVLRGKTPAAPGQSVAMSMDVHNDEGRTVRLTPCVTDLLGDHGGRIVAAEITFSSSVLQLTPGERRTLQIEVKLPAGTIEGYYSGLLVMVGMPELRALLCVEVRRSV